MALRGGESKVKFCYPKGRIKCSSSAACSSALFGPKRALFPHHFRFCCVWTPSGAVISASILSMVSKSLPRCLPQPALGFSQLAIINIGAPFLGLDHHPRPQSLLLLIMSFFSQK
ncbi:hypothetical protein HPP92_011512 [Vanilla planifolia]|uniref:Uncharacterized protein n=1 Tax=Vanilla planifolia TaxID=51239 RepID=A0A835V3K3_VANPL|nr:hypothetical protein HPP92_011512 [Vanilla planifolia]